MIIVKQIDLIWIFHSHSLSLIWTSISFPTANILNKLSPCFLELNFLVKKLVDNLALKESRTLSLQELIEPLRKLLIRFTQVEITFDQ